MTASGATDTIPAMLTTEIDTLLGDVLTDRRLLEHPFYRRWVAGTLERRELASYAEQYRHFEAALPGVLEEITRCIDDPTARQLVQANLDDERGVPAPHVDLFDDFGRGVGADGNAEATPATEALVGLYRSLTAMSPLSALAAVAAYEVQSAAIATSKADGLRARYGLDARATRFWDVHAGVDEVHGRWIVDALAAQAADADLGEVRSAAAGRRSRADAWCGLPRRAHEAARPVTATAC